MATERGGQKAIEATVSINDEWLMAYSAAPVGLHVLPPTNVQAPPEDAQQDRGDPATVAAAQLHTRRVPTAKGGGRPRPGSGS